jgi:hypothetical protein
MNVESEMCAGNGQNVTLADYPVSAQMMCRWYRAAMVRQGRTPAIACSLLRRQQ